MLQDEDTAEADARVDNLREVVGSMFEFERDAEEGTLAAFLELVTLQTDVDRIDDDDAITLMTVHAAKGLEFPIVMVAGLEEEMFPSRGAGPDDDPEELEEERRLAYVAFTRAEQRLFLSYALTRRVYGELKYRRPSRFGEEMPREALELALANLPHITIYRTGAITAWLARRMIDVAHVNLVNLILNRPVVPEWLQEDCTPERIATSAFHLIEDADHRETQKASLGEVMAMLRGDDDTPPSEQAARRVLDLLARPA